MTGYYRIVDRHGRVHEYDTRVTDTKDGFLLFQNEKEVAYLGSGGFVTGDTVESIGYFCTKEHHLLILKKDGHSLYVQCHLPKLTLNTVAGHLFSQRKLVLLDRSLVFAVKRKMAGAASLRDITVIEVAKHAVKIGALQARMEQEGALG